ncbi:MAG: hypothetical protein WBI14_08665 [Anaerolineaceae bacterium]
MLRKLGWVLTITGLACLAWLIYSWWVNQPINPYFFLGVLGLLLGNTLLRRPDTRPSGDPDGLVSPSMRRQQKEHKSWIQNDRK